MRLRGAKPPLDGARRIESVLTDGSALERFGAMVAAMGGPRDFVDRWRDRLPAAHAPLCSPAAAHATISSTSAIGTRGPSGRSVDRAEESTGKTLGL